MHAFEFPRGQGEGEGRERGRKLNTRSEEGGREREKRVNVGNRARITSAHTKKRFLYVLYMREMGVVF